MLAPLTTANLVANSANTLLNTATSSAVANTLVMRDASGVINHAGNNISASGFFAGIAFVGPLSGNASSTYTIHTPTASTYNCPAGSVTKMLSRSGQNSSGSVAPKQFTLVNIAGTGNYWNVTISGTIALQFDCRATGSNNCYTANFNAIYRGGVASIANSSVFNVLTNMSGANSMSLSWSGTTLQFTFVPDSSYTILEFAWLASMDVFVNKDPYYLTFGGSNTLTVTTTVGY